MIYEYDNSINFLKNTLKEKALVNPSYSLRAFAKRLGLSPGALSLILNRKKKLSVDRAYEVAKALDLSPEETEYFMALIQLEGAKSEALQLQYMEKVKSLNPKVNESTNLKQTILSLEHFKLISNWYGLAVLELLTIDSDWNVKTISKKMGLTKVETELTIERLLKLELIEETENGTYKRAVDTVMIASQVPNEAIRKYYEDVHAESVKSIKGQTPAEKIIGAQVFAFDKSQIEEVRQLTDAFLNDLNALAAKGENRTEVYQALTNIFRLNHLE